MGNIHSDEGMTAHGSKASPIAVPERPDYMAWEYKEMGDAIGQQGKRLHQSLIMDHRCMIDRIVVEVPEQGRHVFYFDVTKNILNLRAAMKAAIPVKAEAGPGRNDPCPCGSGKKHKKCCGGYGEMPRIVVGRGACGTCLEIRKLHRNPRSPVAQCRRCLRRGQRKDRKGWKKASAGMRRALNLAERFVRWTQRGGSLDSILPR